MAQVGKLSEDTKKAAVINKDPKFQVYQKNHPVFNFLKIQAAIVESIGALVNTTTAVLNSASVAQKELLQALAAPTTAVHLNS